MLGAGLGVEGLELAGAAGHPQQDAGHLPFPQLVGLQHHEIGKADRQRGQPRQTGRTQAQRPEETAPAHDALAVHSHLNDVRFDRHGCSLTNAWR